MVSLAGVASANGGLAPRPTPCSEGGTHGLFIPGTACLQWHDDVMASNRTVKLRSVAIVALALVLIGAPIGMAHAATISIDDDSGDTGSRSDIRKVVVEHTNAKLRVKTRLDEVVVGVEYAVYIDTRRANRGPEWLISAYPDSEWVILRVSGWNDDGEPGPQCGRARYSLESDPAVAKVRLPTRCLAMRDRVRVAVRMHDAGNGVDWAPARRDFSRWV